MSRLVVTLTGHRVVAYPLDRMSCHPQRTPARRPNNPALEHVHLRATPPFGYPFRVDLMTAYLNPTDQVSELRSTLARLAAADAPADEPDLGVDHHV